MNRETTDKRIVYARNTEVDNNKIRKALFVNLRRLDMYGVLQMCRSSVVNK